MLAVIRGNYPAVDVIMRTDKTDQCEILQVACKIVEHILHINK
jgi:hypothetical protein